MERVDGTMAIVTGAAGDLGAAEARLLASHGATVVLTDIDEAANKAITKQIDAQRVRRNVAER